MEAVYGRKRQSDRAVRETWMDRFVEMEPAGGFRAIIQLVQNRHARNGS
jgi:hypothetical protein